jgi:hypothetical protein
MYAGLQMLLRALKNLLGRIYTLGGIHNQLRIICEKLNSEKSLSGLKTGYLTYFPNVACAKHLHLL